MPGFPESARNKLEDAMKRRASVRIAIRGTDGVEQIAGVPTTFTSNPSQGLFVTLQCGDGRVEAVAMAIVVDVQDDSAG